MAIAYDSSASTTTGSASQNSKTTSWSHTASSGAVAVVVYANYFIGGSLPAGYTSSATYDGAAMTLAGSQFQGSVYTQVFTILAPNSGTKTVAVTASWTTATFSNTTGLSLSYTGGVGSFGTPAFGVGTSTSATLTTTSSNTGHVVVGAVVGDTPTSYNQTSRKTATNGVTGMNAGDASGSTSVTFSATLASSSAWDVMAIDLIPAAVAGANSGFFGLF